MTQRIPHSLFFGCSLLLAFIVYWPALQGPPLWDDISLWFMDPIMQEGFPYSAIFRNFNWPISVSLQKLTLSIWGYQFAYYHVLNLLLHFGCALLVYQICLKLKVSGARWLFLFFLFHPGNVISVAWMIQLKTLLCFFFAALSFLTLDRALADKKWMPLSWIFFLLSALSKSASLPLCAVWLVYVLIKEKKKTHLLWILPFFMISIWCSYRLLDSEVTKVSAGMVDQQIPAKGAEAKPVTTEEKKVEAPPVLPDPGPDRPAMVAEETINWSMKFKRTLKTSRYYLWKVLMPFSNEPVKAKFPGTLELLDYLHLPFLILLIWFLKAQSLYLVSALILMLPFTGLLAAPYMNITLVSDQHLYLFLPLVLIHWKLLFEKLLNRFHVSLPVKALWGISSVALTISLALTFRASYYYSDEIIFYETSHRADPQNVPILYNLAVTYAVRKQPEKAYQLLQAIPAGSMMERDPYYPDVVELKGQLERNLGREKQ